MSAALAIVEYFAEVRRLPLPIDPATVAPEDWQFLWDLIPPTKRRPKTLRTEARPYDEATSFMLRVTRDQDARALEQERERNPPPTFAVYRPRAPGLRELTPEERKMAEQVAKAKLGHDQRWKDLNQELLLALAKCEPPEHLKAWLRGTARNILANASKKGGPDFVRLAKTHELPSDQNEGEGLLERFANNLSENDLIRWIDGKRGRIKLTKAVDRAFCWDVVRAWAGPLPAELARLHEPTPQELTTIRFDGQPLTPAVATRVWLYCRQNAPDAVELFSDTDTKPEDVYERVHETMKKAFQRAKPKIDIRVPGIIEKTETH